MSWSRRERVVTYLIFRKRLEVFWPRLDLVSNASCLKTWCAGNLRLRRETNPICQQGAGLELHDTSHKVEYGRYLVRISWGSPNNILANIPAIVCRSFQQSCFKRKGTSGDCGGNKYDRYRMCAIYNRSNYISIYLSIYIYMCVCVCKNRMQLQDLK